MKKITLTFAALVMTAVTFAQVVNVVERPENGVNSIIAAEGNDGTGVYCADSFTTDVAFTLDQITFSGTNSNGGAIEPLLESLNIFIYEDMSGTPGGQPQVAGAGVFELADLDDTMYTIDTDTAGASAFTVDFTAANGGSDVLLMPGTYWMVAFPNVASGPAGDGRWNWALSDGPAPISSLLIDPQDLFGAGATNWTTLSDLVAGATSFAWTMTGEETLGVNDAELAGVSVYPNPASDIVNVKVPSNVELTGVSLYDVLGKKVNADVSNGQVNVAGLSRGIYVINVETNAGTLTEKLIIE